MGPFLPTYTWQLTLTAPANEEVVAHATLPWSSNSVVTLVLNGGLATPLPALARPEWVTGEPGQLRVSLFDPTATVIDTIDVAVVLDRLTGLGTELRTYMEWAIAHAGQGLTTNQAEQLVQVHAMSVATSPFGPLDLVPGLGQALNTSPPLGWCSLSGPYTLEGDGEVPDIGDVLHTKVGLFWTAAVPLGLGHLHGATEEYQQRLVQFRTVHQVGGSPMVTEIADLDWHGGLWMWRNGKPLRIDYSVTPGVVVTARWVQWP